MNGTQESLKQKAKNATPGPWFHQLASIADREDVYCIEQEGTISQNARPQDAAHIAAANPAVVLALLQRVEALQEALEEFSTTHLAIKACCQECVCYSDVVNRVRDCTVSCCPLWRYRPYQSDSEALDANE